MHSRCQREGGKGLANWRRRYSMIDFQEALKRVAELPLAIRAERVPLLEAGGRRLSRALRAPWPLPRFDQSAMDGFAVRSADLLEASKDQPVWLRIAGESAAGHPMAGPLAPGQAARISTGAPIPDRADSIVPIERARVEDLRVAFTETPTPGRYIRHAGEDVPENAKLFEAGKRLDPAALAFLAMYNLPEVEVLSRPRVAILTSGDEIHAHGEELGDSGIVGVNMYYLREELHAFGCEPRLFGIVPDNAEAFRGVLAEALDWADLVVSTAGVSVGEHDIVHEAVRALGGETVFWRVSIRPGKPLLVALFDEKPFFGLPGNPLSVFCGTELFVKPFVAWKLVGESIEPRIERMWLAEETRRDAKRLFFVIATCAYTDHEWVVRPVSNQSSGNLSGAAKGNAFLVLEAGENRVGQGSKVNVVRLPTRR